MSASRLARRLRDPFDFQNAFTGLVLTAEDFPGLHRECRGLDC